MPRVAPSTLALSLALCVFGLHLAIAPALGLSVDEAHYALYAYFPDWSYFDHPPLVGWLLWLASLPGANEFTLRLPPALIYLACSGLLYYISAHRLDGGSGAKGLLAVALFSVCPLVQLLGFGLVPEFPLLLWTLLVALLAENLSPHSSLGRWLTFGALLGLAGLSKYTAILLLPSLGFYWLRGRQLAANLSSPRLYLAALVALLLISPVFWWNYRHDWASFAYQIDHAAGGPWSIGNVALALLVQLITYSPLLVIGGFIAFRDAGRPDLRGLLACIAVPVIVLVLAGSGNGDSLPHWSLVGWSLLIPSVCHWVIGQWQRRPVRWLASFGMGMSAAIACIALFLLAFRPLAAAPWAAPALRDMIGWREAAEHARQLVDERIGTDGVILVRNWSRASRIAWYARPMPVQVLDQHGGQFAYWYGEPGPQTRAILIRDNVDDSATPYVRDGLSCDLLDEMEIHIDEVPVNRFLFYQCSGSPGR